MFDTAKGLLVKELAVAKGEPDDDVEAELDEIFSN